MSRREDSTLLRSAAPAVLPSLLLCDFGRLEDEVRRLEDAGVKALHLDVMDGHFVDNLTYGLPLVETFRRLTDLPLDAHLMISNPDRYVKRFAEAGANSLTIHAEAVDDAAATLRRIREQNVGASLAINPGTPTDAIEGCLSECDMVLVMSVTPGFGGQSFQPVALEKLRHLRKLAPPELLLEVDGGVNASTIGACAEAGADLFVVGSAIFKQHDYAASVRTLSDLIAA